MQSSLRLISFFDFPDLGGPSDGVPTVAKAAYLTAKITYSNRLRKLGSDHPAQNAATPLRI